MANMGIINISNDDLLNMRTIKKEDNSDKSKIWLKDNLLYKKDDFNTMKRYKDYFEIFSEFDELRKCVFPNNIFYVDGKYVGYTTDYFEDYKAINFRMHKNKYDINNKKKIMKKIVRLLSDMHELGIVHGDLHTANVICNKKDIKMIDFEKMRIRELEDEPMFVRKRIEDVYYLNLMILSVLFDVNMSYVMQGEYLDFIDQMNFSKELKEYLINCALYKEKYISSELNKYIDSIKRKDIVDGKNLVKSLQL